MCNFHKGSHAYLLDHYVSGEIIRQGDIVIIDGKRLARVVVVIEKGINCLYDYGLNNGGFVIEFTSGGLEAWPEADEDIELVRRAGNE